MKKGINLAIYNSIDQDYFLKLIDLCKELQVDLVKIGVCWHDIEKEQGKYDWNRTDFFINSIKKVNLEILADLSTFPCWANGVDERKKEFLRKINFPNFDGLICIEEKNLPYYQSYLNELVKRYDIQLFEIINEPFGMGLPKIIDNEIIFGKSFEEYLKILEISYKTIKSIRPYAKVGLGAFDYDIILLEKIPSDFFDAICLHPYSHKPNEFFNFDLVENISSEKEIWITEWGVNTEKAGWIQKVSEEKQGEIIQEVFSFSKTKGIEIFCYHTLNDWRPINEEDNNFMGLVTFDLNKKKSFEVYKKCQ